MMFWCLNILLAVAAAGLAHDGEILHRVRRVVGGQPAPNIGFSYQLSLEIRRLRGFKHFCGAVLISDRWALSAAHCLVDSKGVTKFRLRGGTTNLANGGQVRDIEAFFVHPNYDDHSWVNDISAIKVTRPFDLDERMFPIGLPQPGEAVASGTAAVTSGWGAVQENSFRKSSQLRYAVLRIKDNALCNKDYDGWISPRMICASANIQGSCLGDSGGPLVVGNTLVGITAWGKGCGRLEFPDVYTRVASVRKWIARVTGLRYSQTCTHHGKFKGH